jgi:hypothetical protein
MRFARGFVHLPSLKVIGFQEADEVHEFDRVMEADVVGVCFGVVDASIAENMHAGWLIENVEVATRDPLTLRFKNPNHEQFLHRCPTMADALQSGDHDLPEPVKAHLRKRWMHRDDISAKAFRSLGMSIKEIAALPRFARAKFQAAQAAQEKVRADQQAALANQAAENSQARVFRNLEVAKKREATKHFDNLRALRNKVGAE